MSKTAEFRKKHERSMYFSNERIDAFNELAGETILVQREDARGNPYAETLTVPKEIGEFTYEAFDHFVDFIQSNLPDKE